MSVQNTERERIINVAVRNGMKIVDKFTKNFRYVDMNFFLYCAEKINEDNKK